METPLEAVVGPVQQLLPPWLLAKVHALLRLDVGGVGQTETPEATHHELTQRLRRGGGSSAYGGVN